MKRILASALFLLAPVAGCSSSSGPTVVGASSTSAVSVDTTIAATTTEVVAPTTAAPPDTMAPTTTATPLTPGWVALPTDELTGQVAPPCCASNWYGEPSPLLPVDGGPLSDGDYFVRYEWSTDTSAPLELELLRFEQCGLLPEGSCEDVGGPYQPDELGIEESVVYPLTLPLDDQVRVVLVGFRGFPADGEEPATSAAEGTGSDLAELAAAANAAYDQLLAAPLNAGYPADVIVTTLATTPQGGFGPALDGSPFGLSFTYGEAPPLLYQVPFRFNDGVASAGMGTDVLHITSIEVVDGRLTLYVYAGFYS